MFEPITSNDLFGFGFAFAAFVTDVKVAIDDVHVILKETNS